MDRVNQLRAETAGSRDSTLDTTSPPSEAFLTANESSSKYFSLTDSTFDISPIKDDNLASSNQDAIKIAPEPDHLISNLSPIRKPNDLLDSYKIGKHIEAANILSGGVDIFDDNENSYDGAELVIDDNVEIDEKSNPELKAINKEDFSKVEETLVETSFDGDIAIPSKDTEVALQIDGKNVDAIDIGNGLYLYRREGVEEELAAVQIMESVGQQPSFKFLKVRENAEGNLEVYEEIEVEVPKDAPPKEIKSPEKKAISHLPIKDINKMISESTTSKGSERKNKLQPKEEIPSTSETAKSETEINKPTEPKTEVNLNGKPMKFNEARKSPLIGTFTPMTFHSTPNKEGIPLTKTMVDMQLHPSRHSENAKKTIEVNTESCKQKLLEAPSKNSTRTLENSEDPDSNKKVKDQENCSSETVSDTHFTKTNIITDTIEQKELFPNSSELHTCKSGKQMEPDKINMPKFRETEEIKPVSEDSVISSLIPNENKCIVANEIKVECQVVDSKTCKTSETTNKEYCDIKEKVKNDFESESKTPIKVNSSKQSKVSGTMTDTNKDIKTELKNKESIIMEECNLGKESDLNTSVSNINSEDEHLSTKSVKEIVEPNKSNNIESIASLLIKESAELTTTLQKSHTKAKEIVNENSLNEDENSSKTEGNKSGPNSSNELIELKDLEIETNKSTEEFKNIDGDENYTKHTPSVNYLGLEKPIAGSEDKSLSLELKSNTLHIPIKPIPKSGSNVIEESKTEYPDKVIKQDELVNKQLSLTVTAKSESSCLADTKNLEKCSVVGMISKIPVTSKVSAETCPKNISKAVDEFKIKAQIPQDSKNIQKIIPDNKPKSINNNAVPFGKWTEANKQEYLIKIKESKIAPCNTNQIKQTNDLNRRDVLKKIDTQRLNIITAAAKTQELVNQNKLSDKTETAAFSNKPIVTQDTKIPLKLNKIESKPISAETPSVSDFANATANITKTEAAQRQIVKLDKTQDLIDRTIEDMLMERRPPLQMNHKGKPIVNKLATSKASAVSTENPVTPLDEIESQMNELHGIPFIERPPHELPPRYNEDVKTYTKSEKQSKILPMMKVNKLANLKPLDSQLFKSVKTLSSTISTQLTKPIKSQTNKQELKTDKIVDEEILEYPPVTVDNETNKKILPLQQFKDKLPVPHTITSKQSTSKKDNVISDKKLDKFATCISNKKNQKNIVEPSVAKETINNQQSTKSKHDERDKKSPHHHNLIHDSSSKFVPIPAVDSYNQNYQSKLQIAYQSALTAKRHKESPITVIEDKPVKVVYMEPGAELVASKLNIHGKESPNKNLVEPDVFTLSSCDSLDSDLMEIEKSQDRAKKTKHQRKQVLTPVDTPDMELIEPSNVDVESPKKKRKIEDSTLIPESNSKSVIPKKKYLLGRSFPSNDNSCIPQKSVISPEKLTAASAIDSLVKAAEILENQSSQNVNIGLESGSSPQTPMKRGRGRPRKYPLPEGSPESNKLVSPQKKPRILSSSNKTSPKHESSSSDEDSIEEGIKRENWTMGKINENIVCPICNKLFRSENVVFKHVKHCTGPSPNRSESDKRSSRKSQESDQSQDSKYDEDDIEYYRRSVSSKRRRVSKDRPKNLAQSSNEVILIEDTPIKPRISKRDSVPKRSNEMRKKITNVKNDQKSNNLVCEFCGKTFRQFSYLVNHKMQHGKEKPKSEIESTSKSVFCCEVCKKEFRKLHHLVQHRIIHKPTVPSKLRRKSSLEQPDEKFSNNIEFNKTHDDQGAGFRCEPCDKSFRKLHHLVEHRETHDGINRQKTSTITSNVDKNAAPPPQCDVCKKTFRKLHHLIEHKEQHVEEISEKSDDRSIKSALSTKDIIHECSLCYMVFPNEHSLTKHTVICERKKRQSATKIAKPDLEDTENQENTETLEKNIKDIVQMNEAISGDNRVKPKLFEGTDQNSKIEPENKELEKAKDIVSKSIKDKETKEMTLSKEIENIDGSKPNTKDSPELDHKNVTKLNKPESVGTIDLVTPIKKIKSKNKTAAFVTKRQKITPLPDIIENKHVSDEDDIRYMLNPDYNSDDTTEGKLFMKVRTQKRCSLQIERPNSNDLIKRRTSLQHPPKVPRLKNRETPSISQKNGNVLKTPKVEPVSSTDSDDSDIKYSFPKSIPEKMQKVLTTQEPTQKLADQKIRKKSLTGRRKSISGLAKRKSLGKPLIPRHRIQAVKEKTIIKRSVESGHRCDCGQLFGSAALLSRHTSVAHTPPRIRRRRSPQPEGNVKSTINAKTVNKVKPANTRKSNHASVPTSSSTVRKSNTKSVNKRDSRGSSSQKSPHVKESVMKSEVKSGINLRRSAAHKGVPVPEKMRKIMEMSKSLGR